MLECPESLQNIRPYIKPNLKVIDIALFLEQGGCITDVNANNLMLALEPEAASLCCRRPSIAGYQGEDGVAFPQETIYLLLDCGGAISSLTQF